MTEKNEGNISIVFTEVVQKLLEGLLKEMGINDYRIISSPATVNGDNSLGMVSRATVIEESKGKHKFLNLIVKTAPSSSLFREYVPIRKLFDREIYIYTKVFSEFTKLQIEKKIATPFNSYPKLYKSIMNEMNEALIMEDMKESNFQLCDRQQPLNYNHVLMVMREYGKFHALSFALRDQKPEVFNEIYKNTPEVFLNYLKPEELYITAKIESEKALRALDLYRDQPVYKKFQAFWLKMIDIAKMVATPELAGKYAVIGHIDGWVNNLFFKYENNSELLCPSELCIIDWQMARAGSPALDLSYFLFICTDKTLRDQYYNHFIQEYHNSLSSFLRKLGSNPEILFPFTVLQEHLKKFSVYGLCMAVMVLYKISSDSEEVPDYINVIDIEKAIQELYFETKNMNKYCTRIRDVILDFDRLGYEFYNNF